MSEFYFLGNVDLNSLSDYLKECREIVSGVYLNEKDKIDFTVMSDGKILFSDIHSLDVLIMKLFEGKQFEKIEFEIEKKTLDILRKK